MILPVPSILLFVAALAAALSILPAPVIAGKLAQLEGVSGAMAAIVARKRVPRSLPYILGAIGIGLGLAIGGLLSAGALGWQGWLVGLCIAVAGVLIPAAMFDKGWDRRFVEQINQDVLIPLRMVHTLSGSGRKPVGEALHFFARMYAGRSALADLLAGCPASDSPIGFMEGVDMPGMPYTTLVISLKQAESVPESQRKGVLDQQMEMALFNLRHERIALVERRAQVGLVAGVLMILPTLMVAVLAPPMLNMIQLFGG